MIRAGSLVFGLMAFIFCRKKDDLQQAVARQTGSFCCVPFSAGGDVLSEKI